MHFLFFVVLLVVQRAHVVEASDTQGFYVAPAISRDAHESASSDLLDLSEIVRAAAINRGLDPRLLFAVIKVESNGNPYALSPKGAEGLMQLMPGTARLMGVRNSFDPRENIWGGSGYLRMLLDKGSLPWALAAYNAGEERVRGRRMSELSLETVAYVHKVLASYGELHDGAPYRLARMVVQAGSEPMFGHPLLPPHRVRLTPSSDLILRY